MYPCTFIHTTPSVTVRDPHSLDIQILHSEIKINPDLSSSFTCQDQETNQLNDMSTETEFTEAAENVKNLKQKPTDDELLDLYGLYKQATVGPVDTARPGVFDLKGKAKWDAWNARKDLSQEEAKTQYVEYVKNLVKKYGL